MDELLKEIIFKIKTNVNPLPVDIYIQPIFDLSTFQVLGGEVLARGHLHGTIIPFAKIISELDDSEALVVVGKHVINKICSFIQQERLRGLFFSINISYSQIQQKDFFLFFKKTIDYYNIKPQQLLLEITSNTTTDLDDTAKENLHILYNEGFGIAWDNISSLAQLSLLYQLFPTKIIKLQPGKISIEKVTEIKSIINFAKINDIEIIATQLETMKQTSILLKKNITKGQGYIYSRAVSTQEFKQKYINP